MNRAIHPGHLDRLVRAALDPYFDHGLTRQVHARNAAIEREIDAIAREVYDRPDVEELREKWEELTRRYDEDFGSLLDEIQRTFEAIKEELEQAKPELSAWEMPKPKECHATSAAIFDSNREYLNQIEAYKRFQGGDETLDYEPIVYSNQMSLL